MSRTVLIVADAFYPLTLAGAHRPSKLAKFLPAFGWKPLVLCPHWTVANSGGFLDPELEHELEAIEILQVPSPGLSNAPLARVARKVESALWPYSAPRFVVHAMLARVRELLRRRRIDLVWSTYNPGYPHFVASRVARRTGIPWIADFRDLPDQAYRGLAERRLAWAEERVCVGATALTVTTRVLRDKLRARHDRPVVVIENGFDADDYPTTPPPDDKWFSISYFGILYKYRDPRPLFEALDRLSAIDAIDLDRVQVRFFGTPRDQIATYARGYGCSRAVFAERRLGRTEMVREQQRSAVLLNLQSAEAGGAVPSKLLEYLGARRPILNVPGDGGPIDEVLRETGAGATARNADEIAVVLRRWYENWSRDGRLTPGHDDGKLARYTRAHQAGRFAELFDLALTGEV